MAIRINVNIDLPTDDPAEAYRMLNEILVTKETENIGWETTDEWYDSEGPLDQDDIDAACEAYDPEGGAAILDA